VFQKGQNSPSRFFAQESKINSANRLSGHGAGRIEKEKMSSVQGRLMDWMLRAMSGLGLKYHGPCHLFITVTEAVRKCHHFLAGRLSH